MKKLTVLLPFSLPSPELARDLLRDLHLPMLAALASRAKSGQLPSQVSANFDEYARALPHEMWLAQQFGLDAPSTSSPGVASAAMFSFNLPVHAGHWFMLHPAHIHIARDHLVLTDLRQVQLSDSDGLALFDATKPLFDEAGKTLLYGDAHTWFMRADDWSDLQTSTPDATCGHNIDIWMPRSENKENKKNDSARAWRKLQNEVQMQWFDNALNQTRAAQGMQVINSLWLWGGANMAFKPATSPPYSHTYNLHGWPRCFASLAANNRINCSAAELIADTPEHGLLLLNALIAPALTGEWSAWQQELQAMEEEWFKPLLQALNEHKLDHISLIFTDNTRMTEMTTTRLSLKKFWIKPSLRFLTHGVSA